MVSVSHIVRKLVDSKVFIQEAMVEGIISYGALARQLKSEVEQEIGKNVKTHAIVMALKRYAEELKKVNEKIIFDSNSDLTLKTHICDISILRSPSLLTNIKRAYDIIDFESGDFLNVLDGKNEIDIVTNERYREKLLKLFDGEKIISIDENLVSLTVTCPKEFKYTPGIVFNIVRCLSWENINIYKVTTTDNEITLILNKKDALKAYKAIEKLITKQSKENKN